MNATHNSQPTTHNPQRATRNAQLLLLLFLPFGLWAGVSCSVGYENGLPKFYVNGRPQYPFIDVCGCSSTGGCGEHTVDEYVAHATEKVGPRILQLGFEDADYTRPDGTLDWSIVDRKAKRTLEVCPNAQMCINIRFRYRDWARQHPDEKVGYGGKALVPGAEDEWVDTVDRPSAASRPFRQLVCDVMDDLGAHVASAPWGENVVAVRLNYGGATEWFSYCPRAYPDTGVAMAKAFREYLTKTYGTDAALQSAWKDKTVTLATAQVPTAAQRAPGGLLIDPATNRRTVDYYKCCANEMADLLLTVAARTKKAFPGRLVGAYYGYFFNSWPSESANYLLDRVLASPDIDFLSNPPTYSGEVRLAGGSYATKSIAASFVRHGKIHLIEDDTRCHYMLPYANKNYTSRSVDEDRSLVRRNVLGTLFDRGGYQPCDPSSKRGQRPHAFDNPTVLAYQREAFDMLKSVKSLPDDSGSDTAVVVNLDDKYYMEAQYGKHHAAWNNLFEFGPNRMQTSGAVFDILTLDDLLTSKKAYRRLLFLCTFSMTTAERELVRRLTRQKGVATAWFMAPGSITENGFSDDAMSELVGMRLVGSGTLPNVRAVDPAARPAGTFFYPQIPASAQEFRKVFAALGAHLYAPVGCCVRRYGNYMMVHVAQAGTYPIALPPTEKAIRVTEAFSGAAFAPDKIVLVSTGPDTWFLTIEKGQ